MKYYTWINTLLKNRWNYFLTTVVSRFYLYIYKYSICIYVYAASLVTAQNCK